MRTLTSTFRQSSFRYSYFYETTIGFPSYANIRKIYKNGLVCFCTNCINSILWSVDTED